MDLFSFELGFTISTNGHLPTQSHQESISDPTRMNFNETLRSMKQSIKGLIRQFQGVARDIEKLKKGKGSATIEQLVRDNLRGVYSPRHQRAGYQGRKPTRSGRIEGLGGRGYNIPQEENPNVGQANYGGYCGRQQGDKALDKIKWKVPSFKGKSDTNVFLDWELQVENLFMKTEFVKSSHSKNHDVIEANNKMLVVKRKVGKKRLVFDLGGWDWGHLGNERFPSKHKSKLNAHGDSLFKFLNALVIMLIIDLPDEFHVKIRGRIFLK
ncbi:hypothetical protein M9H77_03771 [Catharanthus roseus]|uniref:Uncharacterized protein n=1 Tax=Catharanthus roseus TaxID=4058 RepID=A0ACC0CCP1_CATRO|nr:hypothetical protein M9H77_03771 [Catharanthus roseus]